MILNKKQSDAFSKIIKRGMGHYKCVPHSLGQFEDSNEQHIIGYVLWRDPEANFTTESGDTNQEFYIRDDGEVCVYKDKIFIPIIFRTKNWNNFCNPELDGE